MDPTLPIAHAGHWLPYVGPVVVVLFAVVLSAVRERRRRAQGDAEPDADEAAPNGDGPEDPNDR